MKDYTTNNYCDFLWINDLLELRKNENNVFPKELLGNHKSTTIYISNVIIFGTVIEVKQIGCKGYLYQIDDGTGVIACKHSEEQFEEFISIIEREQLDNLNETLECQQSLEQSDLADISEDDSIFNDRSIQIDEINICKKIRLKGLQSIWNDIYASFNSLIQEYCIGDSVFIQGKLYNYFGKNQIYINCIRAIDIKEEIMLLTIKLQDEPNESHERRSSEIKSSEEKRFSGLVTFDNIQEPNPNYSIPRNIKTPNVKEDGASNEYNIVTPNAATSITFDTFASYSGRFGVRLLGKEFLNLTHRTSGSGRMVSVTHCFLQEIKFSVN